MELPLEITNKIMLYNIHPVAELFNEVFGFEISCYYQVNGNYPSRITLWAHSVLNDGYYCDGSRDDGETWHHWKGSLPWHRNKSIDYEKERSYFQ